MLDRALVETALRADDWLIAYQTLQSASQASEDEAERWRLSSMANCAHVLAKGANGRDAIAQIRELVRLADGHLRGGSLLTHRISAPLFVDFGLRAYPEGPGSVLLELAASHPVYESIHGLQRALSIDPTNRRNAREEPASSFLSRLSPHPRFASNGQKAALHALMTMPCGATLVAALPTGWGKSALFQVGARRWRETDPSACVVVVVPTVALAQDHERTLSTMPGLEGSGALVGGMSAGARQSTLAAFSMGDVPILLVSPEMALGGARNALQEAAARAASGLSGGHLVAVVVDEAHIIASWGRHFRPDFQRLPGFVRELRRHQPALRTLLLSATISDALRKSLRDDFGGTGQADEVVVPEPRNEFDIVWQHIATVIDRSNVLVKAADIIPRPAIIYTTTVKDAEALYGRLRARGYERLALFTGEIDDPMERQEILSAWAQGAIDLVVATSAFGMGVDKLNVRAVLHACVPESADRLYQEIGRAGRDGHQALSLCLWTDGDAAMAADLAIHGWMRPETSVRRWKAIIREVSQKRLFNYDANGSFLMKIPLDARHDLLEKITGQLNRQWNAALLTLLQRCGALRIVGEEVTEAGARHWVAEILRPAIVEEGPDLEATLAIHLTLGEHEAKAARQRAAELQERLHNRSERCFREALFDLVEPSGSPWPCGRCEVCIEAGEFPHSEPSRPELHTAWSTQAWTRPSALKGGASIISPEDPTFASRFDRLIASLAAAGIQQFVTTDETIGLLEKSIARANLDLGFTLLMGDAVPTARVPTAVLLGSGVSDAESARRLCLALRMQFEEQWPELPLLFVLSPDIIGVGTLLSQHLSSHAPMAEQELTRFWSGQ